MNAKVNAVPQSVPGIQDLIAATNIDTLFFKAHNGQPLTTDECASLENLKNAGSNALMANLSGMRVLGKVIAMSADREIQINMREVAELGWLIEHLSEEALAVDRVASDAAHAIAMHTASIARRR